MIQKNNSVLNFEALFRSLRKAYIVFDVSDSEFIIIDENQAHAEMVMAERTQTVGKPLIKALSDISNEYVTEYQSQLLQSIRSVIATGRPDVVTGLHCNIKDYAGLFTTKFWEVTHYPVFEGDAVKSICQLTNDVTERTLSENNLHILAKSKDEFISLASHQLRTPATGVKQYLGMVLEGMAGDVTQPQKALLQKAYESNERQLTIISDLLRVAQLDAGKVQLDRNEVNIAELLSDVIKEQQDTYIQRKQVLQFTVPAIKSMAHVDPDKIRMVFENIIDNAGKYSEAGKTIKVVLTEQDDAVVVAIKDNGVGIASEDIPKLFEKFNRIHNTLSNHVGGTGLGLYWAKKVIDLNGGIIEVASVQEKGSTFSIYLPKSETIALKTVTNGGVYEK